MEELIIILWLIVLFIYWIQQEIKFEQWKREQFGRNLRNYMLRDED